MEIWCILITEKFLFWSFRESKIRSFFEPKSWWKDDIYVLLKSSYFELFGDRKYGLFLSEEVDGKMIFTCSFLAFHQIPGLGKYGFLCIVKWITSNFLKAVFHKLYLIHSWVHCPIYYLAHSCMHCPK